MGTTSPLSVTIAVTPPAQTRTQDRVPKSATRATQPRAVATDAATAPTLDAMPSSATEAAAPPAPLQLKLPGAGSAARQAVDPVRHALEMALEDPRSNTPRPTLSERFDITLGNYECVFTERLQDGTIYRGPGIWVIEPNPDPFAGGGARVCKRKPP